MLGVTSRSRWWALAAGVLTLALGAAPAQAAHPPEQIILPGAHSAEGIASGTGTTFYAASSSPGTSSAATSGPARWTVRHRPAGPDGPRDCGSTCPIGCSSSQAVHGPGATSTTRRPAPTVASAQLTTSPRSSTTSPSPTPAALVHRLARCAAVLRAGERDRRPRARSGRCPCTARPPSCSGLQQQRHPGDRRRQDARRRTHQLGARSTPSTRPPVTARRSPGSACRTSTASCWRAAPSTSSRTSRNAVTEFQL